LRIYLKARNYNLFTARQTAELFAESEPEQLAGKQRMPYRCELHSGPMNRSIERLR
jgi:hypothetical protein